MIRWKIPLFLCVCVCVCRWVGIWSARCGWVGSNRHNYIAFNMCIVYIILGAVSSPVENPLSIFPVFHDPYIITIVLFPTTPRFFHLYKAHIFPKTRLHIRIASHDLHNALWIIIQLHVSRYSLFTFTLPSPFHFNFNFFFFYGILFNLVDTTAPHRLVPRNSVCTSDIN